jgi:hypothetical protein
MTDNTALDLRHKVIIGIKKHAIPVCWQTDEKKLFIEKEMDGIFWITLKRVREIESRYVNP